MNYLIDTCVVSDFVKGEKGTVAKMLSLSPDEIAVSAISRMEVEYGLALNPVRARKLKGPLETFFKTVHLLSFSVEDALVAAAIRMDLKERGTPLGPYDILLAGTALQRNLIFVTSNLKEFSRLEDLQLENWRYREA